MNDVSFICNTEADTAKLAKQCASALLQQGLGGYTVFLNGDLGAGKTTFSRYLIQALGHTGSVKSPTYTLVEQYDLAAGQVYHFDLYRLADPEELEFMGIRDYFSQHTLCLIEWPERGHGLLPKPDLLISINMHNEDRVFNLLADSTKASALLSALEG